MTQLPPYCCVFFRRVVLAFEAVAAATGGLRWRVYTPGAFVRPCGTSDIFHAVDGVLPPRRFEATHRAPVQSPYGAQSERYTPRAQPPAVASTADAAVAPLKLVARAGVAVTAPATSTVMAAIALALKSTAAATETATAAAIAAAAVAAAAAVTVKAARSALLTTGISWLCVGADPPLAFPASTGRPLLTRKEYTAQVQ